MFRQPRRLLESSPPSGQQMIEATWRAEALLVLLWALEKVQPLQPSVGLCDIQLLRSSLPCLLESAGEFIAKASLRRPDEITDAYGAKFLR